MGTNPVVSICIPTYKGAEFLAATIDSVLGQTYQDFELWVVDDNSPDDTQAIVERYTDPRVNYVRNSTNLGPEGNWNKCLELARGRYYKLLPHDDLLHPTCVEEQVSILDADNSEAIALVFGSRQIIDPSGRVFMERKLPHTQAGRIKSKVLIKRCVRAGTNLIGEPGNGMFRRSLVEKVGTYDASHPYLVDLDYWFRILAHGDAYYTKQITSSFRVCAGSWSVSIGNAQYRDFKGFVDKFVRDARYGITHFDRLVGLLKARLNTAARAVVYTYLFKIRK